MQDKDAKFCKIVGNILREQRKMKNDKFTIFCYENDIATSTLDTIEKGKARAYFSIIARVVKALGLSFEEFGRMLDKELPEDLFKDFS